MDKIFAAICDDEPEQCEYLQRLLCEYGEKSSRTVEVSVFNSAESFLFDYRQSKYDVLLLDIQMGGKNGMELAREIRRLNDGVSIIFITGIADFAAEGYDVSALHYLLKPIEPQRLFDCLDKVSDSLAKSSKNLLISRGGESLRIPEAEIIYIEALSRLVTVYTESKSYQVSESFGSLTKRLSEDFIHCHRSYCVNLRFIRRITKSDIILDSGAVIPLSRRLYAGVNNAFIEYYRRDER